jgi:hypothetical protein
VTWGGNGVTTAVGVAIVAMCALTVLPAEQETTRGPEPSAFTVLDTIEIQQLVRKYAWALDGGDNYVRHFITNHAIEPSPGGAIGREYSAIIDIGENGPPGRIALGGRYDDEYVKTPQGWRFKSRTVMTAQELAAGLTVQDVRAIRRLAGTHLGQFDDVYVAGVDGVKRFRASGVAMGLSAEGVTGRAFLKNNGGHYEDVYVRTPDGGWRFKSRVHVSD